MNYWEEREQIERVILSEEQLVLEIEKRYNSLLLEIEKEINDFYARYSSKEGISIAEARKRARNFNVEAFADKAKKYVKEKNFSDTANQELRIYNLKMKISRLDLLKANINLELSAFFNDLEKRYHNILSQKAMDELKRQAGILGKTMESNQRTVDEVVNGSFHEAKYSDRIWMYQNELRAELDKLLVKGLVQGKGPLELARQLCKAFDVSVFDAKRLLITELSRVQLAAQKASYETYGYKEYMYIAEPTACKKCKPLDKQIFPVSEMKPGKNASPMHPFCKCSTAAHASRAELNKKIENLS